ncbi:CTD small phosphatase-like protein 2 [Plecturocebus cupreus]
MAFCEASDSRYCQLQYYIKNKAYMATLLELVTSQVKSASTGAMMGAPTSPKAALQAGPAVEAEEVLKQLDMKHMSKITTGITESSNGAASSNQAVQHFSLLFSMTHTSITLQEPLVQRSLNSEMTLMCIMLHPIFDR